MIKLLLQNLFSYYLYTSFPYVDFMFSQKGQESAPFELLIAIIVMTFVIVVGFNALNTLNKKTCEGNLNQNIEQIKSAIESVAKNKSKINIGYDLPSCFNESDAKLRIIERNDISYCSAICGGSLAQCTILQFSSTRPSYTETKCLRISAATSFPVGDPCNTAIFDEDYDVVDWKDYSIGLIPGAYTLMRQGNLVTGSPKICVYKRA